MLWFLLFSLDILYENTFEEYPFANHIQSLSFWLQKLECVLGYMHKNDSDKGDVEWKDTELEATQGHSCNHHNEKLEAEDWAHINPRQNKQEKTFYLEIIPENVRYRLFFPSIWNYHIWLEYDNVT